MSDLVGNPEDRFSHNEAHFIYLQVGDVFMTEIQDMAHLDHSKDSDMHRL